MEKVIVIVGPTAVGKTQLSLDLAKCLDTEIISGDSMQIYKGMDIGTGKVTKEEMGNIPHYMLDIKEPNESFSVAEYKQLVETYITEVNAKGKIPIIVGGTGLYIQSVLFDYQFSEQKRDEKITKKLELLLEQEGNIGLHNRLQQVDPEQAEKIHPNNYRRVIRALEVFETTGKTMSERHEEQSTTPVYDHLIIGLEMDRGLLYEKINNRVDQMINDGLVAEVKQLYENGFEQCQSMKAIGYKEIIPYLKEDITLNQAVEMLKRNSRRYAKRQYTWFKNQMNVNWYNVSDERYKHEFQEIFKIIRNSFTKTV